MDSFIKNTPELRDIHSLKARENFDMLASYLYDSLVPDESFHPLLSDVSLEECHDIISPILYNDVNCILANIIIQEYTEIEDKNYINGWASDSDINASEMLVWISSVRYQESVGTLEHEIVHSILTLNKNDPEKQYMEVLSSWAELVTMASLSEIFKDPDFFIYALFDLLENRILDKISTKDFRDKNWKLLLFKDDILESYKYMLGFIYAVRLLELYYLDPEKVFTDFNLVLGGKKKLETVLEEYHISLEDEDTIASFIQMVDAYREFVSKKCAEGTAHKLGFIRTLKKDYQYLLYLSS